MPKIFTNNVRKLIKSYNFYQPDEIDIYEKFARFGYLNPYTIATHPREYIFFTKPDLHIFDSSKTLNKEIGSDPFFVECMRKYYKVLRTMQSSYTDTTPGPFINLLTNSVKSDLDLPSISVEESESASNIYGTAISYIRSSERSDENHDFSLEFKDNDNLALYMLFKIWDEYERKKDLGMISPALHHIENRELHDQVSVYKIIVGDDGESILYYAKGYGVYPKGVPRDTFSSFAKDEGISYTVNFHAEFVDDVNPLIISEFNTDVSSYKSSLQKDIPIYDYDINSINGDWCNIPYIAKFNKSKRYKLLWR